jgi:hypothetical protein
VFRQRRTIIRQASIVAATQRGYLQLQFDAQISIANLIAYGRDNSVGTANRYALDGPAIESLWRRDLPHPSRLVMGPTQPHVQKTPYIFPGD